MDGSDADRRELYLGPEATIGETSAGIPMELSPHATSRELATRFDLHATTLVQEGEMAELRSDMDERVVHSRFDLATWLIASWASMVALMVAGPSLVSQAP